MSSVALDLSGRVAVVTGAQSGFGKAICKVLTEADALVYGTDYTPPEDIQCARYQRCDLRDREALSHWADAVNSDAGGAVDIVVNNAGGALGQAFSAVEDTTDEAWESILDVNLNAAFAVCRSFAKGMKSKGTGSIVNISSGAGVKASLTGIQAYCSAKHGLNGLTRQLAAELGSFGIRVNAVAPGLVLNDANKLKKLNSYDDLKQQAILNTSALKRPGSNKDIANLVAFLASDLASWITGQIVAVDGGSV